MNKNFDEVNVNDVDEVKDEIYDDVIESEDADDFEIKRFSFSTYKIERSIRDIIDWIRRDKIEIPKFQRHNVWNFNQSSRFIESVLLGLPTPDLFMYRKVVDKVEKYVLIDGLQRITTIEQFFEGNFMRFDGVSRKFKINIKNSNWKGRGYSDLLDEDQDYFNDYSLKISVFDVLESQEEGTERNLMSAIFERINTGSTILTTQEIRNAIYQGDAIDLLVEYSKSEILRNLIDMDRAKTPTRRGGEEFLLRLITYLHVYNKTQNGESFFDDANKIKFQSSKKVMLNNYLEYINTNNKKVEMKENILRVFDVLEMFGENDPQVFTAFSLKRQHTYDKVYEPFAEGITILAVVNKDLVLPTVDMNALKRYIWNTYEKNKDGSKKYAEFFENTTSIDNVSKRVKTLKETLESKK